MSFNRSANIQGLDMNRTEKVNILFSLGRILSSIGCGEKWPGYEVGINEAEYKELEEVVEKAHIYNAWFTADAVRESFRGIASWLNEETLGDGLSSYDFTESAPKRVAVIMAGNIPLVGFHDFLSVFLSGNVTVAKLSSADNYLFPVIVKLMTLMDERMSNWVEIADGQLTDFDAVIATGSTNSSRHFEYYFGAYPNIIRKNRNSIAVIDGTETEEELHELGKDIFTYFGLGCRNVAQLWIPEDFDVDRFFRAIYGYSDIINHFKYANNYQYNRAVHLMNLDKLLDNGFLLLKEDDKLQSPLGMLYYQRYKSPDEVEDFVEKHRDDIQVVIGKKYLPFGQAQQPAFTDFADGVDTLRFLEQLSR